MCTEDKSTRNILVATSKLLLPIIVFIVFITKPIDTQVIILANYNYTQQEIGTTVSDIVEHKKTPY